MPDGPTITNVRLIAAPPGRGNLLAFVRADIAGLVTLDLILVRTGDGLTIAYPKRRDRAGRRHSIVSPVNARAREAIEATILTAITDEVPS